MPGLPPGIPGIPPGMHAQVQAVPRPPTSREVREIKRKNRLSERASFAANLLQNSVRSGSIKLYGATREDSDVEFATFHVMAAFEYAELFFAAVDEMVAESERQMNVPEIVTDGDA